MITDEFKNTLRWDGIAKVANKLIFNNEAYSSFALFFYAILRYRHMKLLLELNSYYI